MAPGSVLYCIPDSFKGIIRVLGNRIPDSLKGIIRFRVPQGLVLPELHKWGGVYNDIYDIFILWSSTDSDT